MVAIYSNPGEYLPINDAREHLCGYYNQRRECINAPTKVDERTGHTVCSECRRVTTRSGLRLCDLCDKQFIDLDKFIDPKYDVNCPKCVREYGL
jgi:hypothetical protein